MFSFKSLIDFFLLALIYFKFFYPRWEKQDRLFLKTVFYLNAVGIIWVTLMPFTLQLFSLFQSSYQSMHMVAFEDLILGRPRAILEVVLNIIMLMPLGFLLPLVYDIKPVKAVVIVFLTSLSIELVQPLLGGTRASDITDLITNTLGGLVGVVLYQSVKKSLQRFK